MSAAPLAGLAGALAVLAAWEALAAVEAARLPARVVGLLGPLRRAGRQGDAPTEAERRRLAVVGAGVLCAAGWLVAGLVGALVAGAAGPWTVAAAVRARRRRYRTRLERAAPAVARALADALGAGHAVPGAIGAAVRGLPEPAAGELARVADALVYGEPVESALARLRDRAGLRAYDTLVAAILLQREAGGPLATLLRDLARALEEGARLEDDARAATAQARFTALVVVLLPVGAAGLAELAEPGYVGRVAASPLGAWLGGCALVLQAGALVAIRRVARVRE